MKSPTAAATGPAPEPLLSRKTPVAAGLLGCVLCAIAAGLVLTWIRGWIVNPGPETAVSAARVRCRPVRAAGPFLQLCDRVRVDPSHGPSAVPRRDRIRPRDARGAVVRRRVPRRRHSHHRVDRRPRAPRRPQSRAARVGRQARVVHAQVRSSRDRPRGARRSGLPRARPRRPRAGVRSPDRSGRRVRVLRGDPFPGRFRRLARGAGSATPARVEVVTAVLGGLGRMVREWPELVGLFLVGLDPVDPARPFRRALSGNGSPCRLVLGQEPRPLLRPRGRGPSSRPIGPGSGRRSTWTASWAGWRSSRRSASPRGYD